MIRNMLLETALYASIFLSCNQRLVFARLQSDFVYRTPSELGKSLSRNGLGSSLHLINTIDTSFAGQLPLRPLEDIPSSPQTSESLHAEPIPQMFHSRQEYGGFALFPSFIELDSASHKDAGSMIEVASSSESQGRVSLSAELKELDYLNHLIESNPSKSISNHPRRMVSADALRFVSHSDSGNATVDFYGVCTSGFNPFLVESQVSSLSDCWSKCTEYYACTQVHHVGDKCHLSSGISTHALPSGSPGTCRTLTAAGLHPNIGLPVFKILGNLQVQMISDPSKPFQFVASTLAECQSACLDINSCAYGVWILNNSNPRDSVCIIGADIAPSNPNVAKPFSCKEGGFICQSVCGDSGCLLFSKTLGNYVQDKSGSLSSSNDTVITRTNSCEQTCTDSTMPSVCVDVCVARERSFCQLAASSNNRKHISFSYGNMTDQVCGGGGVSGTTSFTEYYSSVELVMSPSEKKSSLVEGGGFVSFSSGEEKIVPNYSTFQGACATFDEGLLLGSGPGLSKFLANSIDECWGLCQEFMPECTQVQFHLTSKECILGDAITSSFNIDSDTICRSLDYMPIDSTNGLPGMMFTDSVGDSKNANSGDVYWFSGTTSAQTVASLEACQALCKAVDSNGAGDMVCRYGGYQDCSSFFTSVCPTAAGMGNPDCASCQSNPTGGICRIPQLPAESLGRSQQTAASVNNPVAPICLGGQCRWFEKSATGYSLTVKTPVNPNIDFLPANGLICESGLSYLPAPVMTSSSSSSSSPSETTHPAHQCYYPVESLWHCQSLCSAVNQFNGSGTNKCIAGLYADGNGLKKCYLAQYRLGRGQACVEGNNCSWFELDGKGDLDELQDTGMALASQARSQSTVPYDMGVGPCLQFKAFGPRITKYVSQIVYGDAVKECATACSMFPQCVAFQVTGQIVGPNPSACDITKLNSTDCTSVECVLSSTITGIGASNNTNQICWSKTPTGTIQLGDDEIDMENVDPGLPGFYTINSRVRKFGWPNVVNQNKLPVTASMEECQAICRATDGCITGSWQVCSAIQQYCNRGQLINDMTPELTATCNACSSVTLSSQQPAVAFPVNFGVCKLSQSINNHIEGCQPEPCYSFEAGSDEYYILSMTKNPFSAPGAPNYMLNNEVNAYFRTKSLKECQSFCTPAVANDPNDPRTKCKYGLYIPRANGYGECYLTELEIRENHGNYWQIKQATTVNCEGTCIVFIKLNNQMPTIFSGGNTR